MTALLAAYAASLVGSRWLAKTYPDRLFFGLLTLLGTLSLLLGTDERFIGLLLGLSLVHLSMRIGQRWPNFSGFRVAGLVLAGGVAFQFGYRIEYLTNPWGGFFALHELNLPLTLLWIAAVSSALGWLSLMERSGRLFAQVMLVALGALLVIELLERVQVGLAPMALGLTLLGFILGSWRRPQELSRMSGELGFCLALLSISGLLKGSTSLALLVPLLAFSVPLLSSPLAIIPSLAWRFPTAGPLNHWLARRGHPQRVAALVTYLGAASLAILLAALAHPAHPYIFGAGLLLAALTARVALWPSSRLDPVQRRDAPRIEFFGVPLDRVSLTEAATRVLAWVDQRSGPQLVATPDTLALMRARGDDALRAVYQRAALVTADGTGIVWAARLFGVRLPERVTGIDLVEAICQRATALFLAGQRAPCRLCLLGARAGVAAEAAGRLETRYPGVTVVGTHHGYFSAAEAKDILNDIRRAAPDILLVGLGVPRQELWMKANQAHLDVPVVMGVGGSLDVLSGRLRRAPRGWQRLGLEWAYRAAREPRRLWRLWVIPLFVARVLICKALQLLL